MNNYADINITHYCDVLILHVAEGNAARQQKHLNRRFERIKLLNAQIIVVVETIIVRFGDLQVNDQLIRR